MIYTPISPPWRAVARFRPETPAALSERRRERLARLTAQFERDDIEAAVDGLIAMLDQRDGDADMEDDERAAIVMREPGCDRDYADEPLPPPDGMPGDPVDAEPDDDREPDDDAKGDPAWIEWHTRGKGRQHAPVDRQGYLLMEDDEDDDPAEDDGDAEDGNGSEDDDMTHAYAGGAAGAGCPIADGGGDAAWPERDKQPDYMFGGLAGMPGDEDAEPWRTAPHWPTPTANDNERRAA